MRHWEMAMILIFFCLTLKYCLNQNLELCTIVFYRSEETPILIVTEKIILRKGRVLWKMYITMTLKLAK